MLASRGPNKSLSIVSVILELVPRKGGGNMGLAFADGWTGIAHDIAVRSGIKRQSPGQIQAFYHVDEKQ